MIVLGIDPGITGGLAAVEGDAGSRIPRLIGAWDLPVAGDGWGETIDPLAMIDLILRVKPDVAFIERAQAMPYRDKAGNLQRQGASSDFKYGRAVGYLECAVLGCRVPLRRMEVVAWKRGHQIAPKKPDETTAQVKERSRQRAIFLFPSADCFSRKMDHGRAEAALIGAHGLFLLGQGDERKPRRRPSQGQGGPTLFEAAG